MSAKVREVVEVVTERVTFTVGPGQEPATPGGWVVAREAGGATLAWTHPRKLCRKRLVVEPGYAFGYFMGATCADATVGRNACRSSSTTRSSLRGTRPA
ncbi:hypothetical protein [Streptomyces antibioticus]|uniref:hypothetical protein n=1 Tax=Streptomyces antibioticus TaxID=1890 RepID=UPI003D719542